MMIRWNPISAPFIPMYSDVKLDRLIPEDDYMLVELGLTEQDEEWVVQWEGITSQTANRFIWSMVQ